MTTSQMAYPANRHPWLDQFTKQPLAELDRLLNGQARISPFDRADAADAARLLFGGLTSDDRAVDILDRTLFEWLDARRIEGLPTLESLAMDSWVRTIISAFDIIGLLGLPSSATRLRRNLALWTSWAERLAISSQRDGNQAFLRALALTQRIVAVKTKAAFDIEPLWLRLCERAGDSFPAHYIELGLLGLRLLPERNGAASERTWLNGLARWATSRKPQIREFSRHWWALKAVYPRMPAYWRTAVSGTLDSRELGDIPVAIKDWWLADIGVKGGDVLPETTSRSAGIPRLRPAVEREALQRRVSEEQLPSIRGQVDNFVREREYYAEVTGDSYYLVTTACSLGMEIIKGEDNEVDRGRLAASLARKALAWEPANVFAWSLWRDALAKQGALEAAELVGWETIRRFPENVQWRNQLAYFFAGLPDRQSDSEQLLREAIRRFPGELFSRCQLAELLIGLDRIDEATEVAEEALSLQPDSPVVFALRARLHKYAGDTDSAKTILRLGLNRHEQDELLEHYLRNLEAGNTIPLLSAAWRTNLTKVEWKREEEDQLLAGTLVNVHGRLRRTYFRYHSNGANRHIQDLALEEVRSALAENPNLTYARALDLQLSDGQGDRRPTGSFAAAFMEAIKRRDRARLDELTTFPSFDVRLADAAKTFLFRDANAGARILSWLKEKTKNEGRQRAALRGFLLLRFDIPSIPNGDTLTTLVAANDNFELDLVESTLATEELLLAA